MKTKIFLTLFFVTTLFANLYAWQSRFIVTETETLGIEITNSTIDFGTSDRDKTLLSSSTATTMLIKNTGSVIEDLQLSVTDPLGYQALSSTTTSGMNKYRLYGMFMPSGLTPRSKDFELNDIITTTATLASSTYFALDSSSTPNNQGWAVSPGKSRNLYFKLDVPLYISTNTDTLIIPVQITAVQSAHTTSASIIGASGGTAQLFDGAFITIPQGALATDTTISVEQLLKTDVLGKDSTVNGDQPVCVYKFLPAGLVFKKPAQIKLYFSEDEIVSRGITRNELKVFWWDSKRWVIIGGEVSSTENSITANIQHFSIYAVFPAPPADLTASDYRPKNAFLTPATQDGVNDIIQFGNMSGNYEIKIVDITGRIVRTLKNESIWNGTDELGNIVESGVYIYQFEAEIGGKKELLSGTVTVAK